MSSRPSTDGGSPSATATLRAIVEDATGEPLRIEDGTPPGHGGNDSGDGPGWSAAGGPTALVGRNGGPSPTERLRTLIESASSLVAVVPRIELELVDPLSSAIGGTTDAVSEPADSGPIEARIVLTGAAAARVAEPTGRMALTAVEATDGVDLFVHDGDSPVGLLLVDDRAAVGLFDESGLAALLITDEDAVRAWVGRTVRRYLSGAREPSPASDRL